VLIISLLHNRPLLSQDGVSLTLAKRESAESAKDRDTKYDDDMKKETVEFWIPNLIGGGIFLALVTIGVMSGGIVSTFPSSCTSRFL
jgi:hypothetical protein